MAQSPVAVQVPGMQVSFGRWQPKAPSHISLSLFIPLIGKCRVLLDDWFKVTYLTDPTNHLADLFIVTNPCAAE